MPNDTVSHLKDPRGSVNPTRKSRKSTRLRESTRVAHFLNVYHVAHPWPFDLNTSIKFCLTFVFRISCKHVFVRVRKVLMLDGVTTNQVVEV